MEKDNKNAGEKRKKKARVRGQIRDRGDGKYVVRIFQGRDASGKRHWLNKTIDGKKAAEKYLTAKLRHKDLGFNIEPATECFDLYLDKWLETIVKPRVRARTYEDYTGVLKRYVRQPLGPKRLADLNAAEIQGLYQSMLNQGLSARVVRYTHALLNSAFKQAVKWDMVFRNPCAAVTQPRQVRQEMKAMTTEQSIKFLAAVEGTRMSALFTFALTTGMRPQEYLGLKWTDLDLARGTATVRRAIVWSQKKGVGWHFDEPKTPQSRRTMPLPASTVKALIEHKRRQGEERLRVGPDWQDYGLVFATQFGKPIDIPTLTKQWFKPALVKAELSGFRLYDLRHTHATLLLSNGENPKVAAERLGHSTIVHTLDTYSHVLPDMQQEAAVGIENSLFPKFGALQAHK
jgi:integrase